MLNNYIKAIGNKTQNEINEPEIEYGDKEEFIF